MKSKKQRLIESAITKIVRKVILESESNQLDDTVEEIVLFAENESRLYDVLMKTYLPALKKFVKRGNFDRDKALKLMEYYWTNYVRPEYKKQFGDVRLNPTQRKQFSEYFLSNLESEGYLDQGQ